MLSNSSKCDTRVELDCKREILQESINECISVINSFISRNKANEIELTRLIHLKENFTYIKDVLLQDLYQSNVNAGKRRNLLRRRLDEFQEKKCTAKFHLENIPGVSQVKELVQSNEQLLAEQVKWTKILESLQQEYSNVFSNLENGLKMKIIEFSQELSKINKENDNRNNNPMLQ